MNVHFYSKTDDFEIDFITEAKEECGFIKFKDESLENTDIYLKYENDILTFKRTGDVVMDVSFKKGSITEGHYKSNMGLEFYFEADTKELSRNQNKIELFYHLLIEGEFNNACGITVLLND